MTLALAERLRAAAPVQPATKIQTVLPEFRGGPIPVQPTLELERLYQKQRLAAGYRLFGRQGFDMGGAGHITARDPEHPDRFWVNPLGVHFRRIKVSDLMLVSHEGEIFQPQAEAAPRLNRAAFAIHCTRRARTSWPPPTRIRSPARPGPRSAACSTR
jgi:hypothetical protein